MAIGVVVRWVSLGVALATMLACTRTPMDDAYFPLGDGRSWTYAITRDERREGEAPVQLTVAVVGKEEVSGQRVTRERIAVDGEEHFLFVGVDEHGIFRHATQSPGQPAPSVEDERDYFLVQPLQVGETWKGQAAPTFLDVGDVQVPIQSTVVSTTDTVKTPAGEFTGCVKIRVTGKAEIHDEEASAGDAAPDDSAGDAADATGEHEHEDADAAAAAENPPLDGSGTFTLEEETWYAKDVGVVKTVIVEAFTGKAGDQRTRVTTELQSFKR